MGDRSTASIIVIGDELLKGQIQDTNSHFLCQELYKCGIKVLHVSFIPDDVQVIAEEVLAHTNKYNFVFTTGGIGPTHDDVTYEGIAKSFNEKLIFKKELQDAYMNLCSNLGLSENAVDKMSYVPESSVIYYTKNIPIISVKNVFIFPGIPSYLRFAFLHLKHMFCDNTTSQYYTSTIYVDANEFSITSVLNKAVSEYGDKVKFGSYPDVENPTYQVKLTLETDSENTLNEAEGFIRSFLPNNIVVGPFSPSSDESLNLLLNFIKEKSKNLVDREFSEALIKSCQIIESCLEKYNIDNICLSFNGGKDCTVLLHLAYLIFNKALSEKPFLTVLYVRSKQPFPEIEDFIQKCVERYHLNLITYDPPIKTALHKLKADYPEIKAILMGCRHSDPYCSTLQTFQNTDKDWPEFVRVNPLLHWNYSQIWKCMHVLNIPYCSLYDKGYTSLGCQNNTLPNQKLYRKMKNGEGFFLPAYFLKESEQERDGRKSC